MIAKPVAALLGLLFAAPLSADIFGDYTLTMNQTFTSSAGDIFEIGGKKNSFNLQNRTATLTGTGDFEISSQITGTGSIMIDLTNPSRTVRYISDGNAYTGTTTVRSGRLSLETPQEGNNSVGSSLVIGGGPNLAVVTRDEKHNRELIPDTTSITINQNGILEFARWDNGNSANHDSQETFRRLILNGGTLLNSSPNTRLTTVNILDNIQLLSSSVIDMGIAMTIRAGDIKTASWATGAILTIKNWSTAEPFYVGEITGQQLSQIRFDLGGGLYPAMQLGDGQLVPNMLVPEASALLFVPLLAAAALWPEFKKRGRRRSA